MTPTLTPTTMSIQRFAHRNVPEPIPLDVFDAADAHARSVYVGIADALPGGRKSLGLRQWRRVSCFANGSRTPTASDWLRLYRANETTRDAVIAYYAATIDHLRGLPVPNLKLTVASYFRETNEGGASVLEYEADPTPENLTRATNEVLDAANASNMLARGVLLMRHLAVETRTVSVRRLKSTRAMGGTAR